MISCWKLGECVGGKTLFTLTQVGSYYILDWPAIHYGLSKFASDYFWISY